MVFLIEYAQKKHRMMVSGWIRNLIRWGQGRAGGPKTCQKLTYNLKLELSSPGTNRTFWHGQRKHIRELSFHQWTLIVVFSSHWTSEASYSKDSVGSNKSIKSLLLEAIKLYVLQVYVFPSNQIQNKFFCLLPKVILLWKISVISHSETCRSVVVTELLQLTP